MRFETLSLEAYGMFAGRNLTFRPDAFVHIVLGPNEAGKTSALSAIGDLLFGFGGRTNFDFRHGAANLRVGAQLRLGNGNTLNFRRRKGTKNTLIDEANKPLDENLLTPVLGTLKRDAFETEFGLTADSLRRGGNSLLDAGGKLSETLAASSVGLSALTRLRGQFQGESDGLFSSRKSGTKPFYVALQSYEDAERQVRDAIVTSEALKSANNAVEEAQSANAVLATEHERLGREIERLKRAQQTIPKLDRLARARRELTALPLLDPIAGDSLAQWKEALAKVSELIARLAEIEDEDAKDRLAAESLRVDDNLMSAAPRIRELHDKAIEVRKGLEDMPRRREDLLKAQTQLEDAARRLGLTDVAGLIDSEPSAPDLARMDDILASRLLAENEVAAAEKSVAKHKEDIERLDSESKIHSHPADPTEMLRSMDALRAIPADAARLLDLQVKQRRALKELDEECSRLQPAVALSALARMALPELTEIDAAITRLNEIEQDAHTLTREADGVARDVLSTEKLVARLSHEAAAATPEQLAIERARRDQALDSLAENLDASAEARRASLLAVRQATQLVDRIADALLNGAKRLAELQSAAQGLAEKQDAKALIAKRIEACEERRAAALADCATLWGHTGLTPSEPARMRRWRTDAAALLQRREALNSEAREIEVLDLRLEDRRPVLNQIFEALARTADLPDSVEALYDLARVDLAALQKIWNDTRDRAGERRKAERDLRQAQDTLDKARERHEHTLSLWPAAAVKLGLSGEANAGEAKAALGIWRQVPESRTSFLLWKRSISGIEGDVASFDQSVASLVGAIAPDLTERHSFEIVDTLGKRLVSAERVRDQAAAFADKAQQRDQRRGGLAAEQTNLQADLARASALTGVSDPSGLQERIKQLESLNGLNTEIAAISRDLAETAFGHDEEALRTEQADLEFDALPSRIEKEQAGFRARQGDLEAGLKKVHDAERACNELMKGRGAADFAQEKMSAGGALLDIAEEWILRHAAARLATHAIERHRDRMQDPLVLRASELFKLATGGAFSRLAPDYDKNEQPTLAAVRASGETVAVAALSEGTRDQLFLALRLALLETRAGEPLPFIGDDILASFDDERTGCALELLADFGTRSQTILFTHHRHVADIARIRLGDRADVIEMID